MTDKSNFEAVQFTVQVPENWDEGALLFQVIWHHSSKVYFKGLIR